MQQTSINAYEEIKPTLGDRQQLVFSEILKHDNVTNSELVSYLNIPINTVTARVFELRKIGKVAEDTKRTCNITGRKVIAWRALDQTLL